jgi:hypothetical protein
MTTAFGMSTVALAAPRSYGYVIEIWNCLIQVKEVVISALIPAVTDAINSHKSLTFLAYHEIFISRAPPAFFTFTRSRATCPELLILLALIAPWKII